ncbi:type VI secretion system PAAR protein [Halodesulfovibrio aestuarii]|uniref:Type VI secretion system PAAR protein n=1 Tax=Halodesulfovibrio aestuarii TaxID=126333 RepID=A0ABV4JXX0_9BACT
MRKAVKVGDIGTEHDGFHPTKVTAGSSDVFIDGKPAARVGDPLEPHDKPNNPKHNRAIATGSSTVFINGKPAALTGGRIDCGGVTIGSGTVNIGDQPPAGSAFNALSESLIYNRKFIIRDAEGTPIANMPYKIELANGKIIKGITNLKGETNFTYSQNEPIDMKVYTRSF